VLDAADSNTVGFLWRDTCVSLSQLNSLFRQRQLISTFKTIICRKYSFQKLILFSLGNKVLDANASNTNGCLWRDTCRSSTQLNRPFCNKMSLSPPWKLWFSGSIPFKN
jgi:hypothetical protein